MTAGEELDALILAREKGRPMMAAVFYRLGKRDGFIKNARLDAEAFRKWLDETAVDDEWISFADVARENGIGYSSVKNQVYRQGIEVRRMGNKKTVYVRKSDVGRILSRINKHSD